MSIIREKIKYIGTNMSLKIPLSSDDGFLGYQQEIDNLTQIVSTDLINPGIDVEECRFSYINQVGITTTLSFQFYSGGTWATTWKAAGFPVSAQTASNLSMLNSFFILDFYDSYDINNQRRIFRTYLTKILNLTGTLAYKLNPRYLIDNLNQLFYWYVPISYINANSGATTTTGYTKFSFYNASDKTIVSFYNSDNESSLTSEMLFFKTELNLVNKTWGIITPSFPPNIIAKELAGNAAYEERINNTTSNFDNLQQNYPSGSTFNQLDGKYF